MSWIRDQLERFRQQPVIGYRADQSPLAEPTAIAALALQAHQLPLFAEPAADWLVERQSLQGEIGVMPGHEEPGWATALALIVWHQMPQRHKYLGPIELATQWLLEARGKVLEPDTDLGHNVELVGWSWAPNTHSWIEPTAMSILALRALGQLRHPRTQEGIKLLIDRQLPAGGCNYGNTFVLGQLLRPHVQPTGVAMAALSGQIDTSGRLPRSLAWLRRQLSEQTTSSSLAWGLLGLAAHGELPANYQQFLEAAAARQIAHENSPYKLAMLLLAAAGERAFPFLAVPRRLPPIDADDAAARRSSSAPSLALDAEISP